jgi:hypothetical protein
MVTHLEARYDHVSEGDSFIDSVNIYSFQFGFDLWIH